MLPMLCATPCAVNGPALGHAPGYLTPCLPFPAQFTDREKKKLADKERLAEEKAARTKEEALRDDDNVFDVAYEQQGDGTDVVSATDIKVRRCLSLHKRLGYQALLVPSL